MIKLLKPNCTNGKSGHTGHWYAFHYWHLECPYITYSSNKFYETMVVQFRDSNQNFSLFTSFCLVLPS